MEHTDIRQALDELQQSLAALSKYTLPTETRGALHSAHHRLKAFSERIQRENTDDTGRLEALYRLSRSLGSSLDLDEVLDDVMESVIELTGAERGFIALVDPDNHHFKTVAARDFDRQTLDPSEMQVSRTVIDSVVDSGEGLVTTDAKNDPRFSHHDSVVGYSLRSILCAPLRASGDIIGVLYADNRAQAGIFSNSDLELLCTFAAHAAIAIDNARLHTQTDRALQARIQELETLSRIDRELSDRLDFDRVVEQTYRWALHGTGGEYGWVVLVDEETGEFKVFSGPQEDTGARPPVEIIQLFKTLKTVRMRTQAGSHAHYLLVPLRYGGATIGGLVIVSPIAFEAEAVKFAERYSRRAATAVQNAWLYRAVRQANEAKSKFVSIVTHELRIPLTSIKGYADLLKAGAVGDVSDPQIEFLNVIRNNADRMAGLISDLSDISRIERGKLSLEVEDFDIGSTIQETVESMQPKLDEKSQQIEVDIPNDIPQIAADPKRVSQILTNLISNAWKYTPEGGMITVRACRNHANVHVEVQDTGIGISKADQEQLFTQFFRSENPAVREVNGWGLGLHVTKKLVELMHGQIGFSSALGEGSKFWFTIPQIKRDTAK